MIPVEVKEELEKQHYRIIGDHSAVKTCHWTKSTIKGKGGCYKWLFYGIKSHQCLQMSSSLSCANRCIYCWRGFKAPVSKEWPWAVDDPVMIVTQSQEEQKKLLVGLKGYPQVDVKAFEESQTIRHVALSLTGEPITYPKINALIAEFHRQRISTFLVTNGQYPEKIVDLAPVTQLYLSMDAPNKELAREVGVPLFGDYWERYLKSLDALAEKPQRTCIRLTCIKGKNMVDPEGYAKLIKKGNPDFVEVKAYMLLGASRERLRIENMPRHQEVRVFAEHLLEHLSGYGIAAEHTPSRVVLLAKTSFKKQASWMTWIDFERFFSLVDQDKPWGTINYLAAVPLSMDAVDHEGDEVALAEEG